MLNGNNCAVTSYSGKKRSLEKRLSLGLAGYFRHKKSEKISLRFLLLVGMTGFEPMAPTSRT